MVMTWGRIPDPSPESEEALKSTHGTLVGDYDFPVTLTGLLTALAGLNVTGAVVVTGTLNVTGLSTLGSLNVTGNTTLGTNASNTLTTNAVATFQAALTTNANTTLGSDAADLLTVNATPTFNAATTFKHNVTVQNSAGTVLASLIVTAGAQTVTLGTTATPGLYIDVANGRTLIGTNSAPTATNDKFQVVGGRSYFSANIEEGFSVGLRFNSTTGTVYLGAQNDAAPDWIVKNNAGTQIFRVTNEGLLFAGDASALVGTAGNRDIQCEDVWLVDGANYRRLLSSGSTFFISKNADGTNSALTIDSADTTAVTRLVVNNSALSGSEELRVTGTSRLEGAVEITTGLLTLASGQISFPATQNPSADANTLDDYEEGTWTPSLGGNTTYSDQTGVYTKIGRLVIAQGRITVTTLGTGSATTISGLPFTVGTAPSGSAGSVGYFAGLASNVTFLTPIAQPGTATVTLSSIGAAGANMTSPTTAFQNGTTVYFLAVYNI